MLEKIGKCNKCPLCNAQKPLMDDYTKAFDKAIMFVGLSAKVKKYNQEIPLDSRTRSGRVIDEFENIAHIYGYSVYRTNIVKGTPLDKNTKLRYPNKNEMDACYDNLMKEIELISPQIIVLLGDIVRDFISQKWKTEVKKPNEDQLFITEVDGSFIVAMYHPSFLLRSKRRRERYNKMFEDMLAVAITEKWDETPINLVSTPHKK